MNATAIMSPEKEDENTRIDAHKTMNTSNLNTGTKNPSKKLFGDTLARDANNA